MRIPLATLKLDLGKPFAATIPEGVRVRVVDGTVWATTSGNPEDTWLQAGEEHRLSSGGLTVLEAAGTRSTVELLPRLARDQGSIGRMACAIAALALAELTIVSLVILPAQMESAGGSKQTLAVSRGRAATFNAESAGQRVAQNARAQSSTRVE
jgi:ferric-dicitrate binding protein FerR (iron transport regulator)